MNLSIFINVVLLIIAVLNIFGKINISSSYVAIGFFYYILIYLPGYYLTKIFFNTQEIDILEIVPFCICMGYLFFLPWTLLAYFLKLHMLVFVLSYLLIVLLWLILYNIYFKKKYQFIFKKLSIPTWILFVLSAILLITLLLADYYGGFISGNFLPHVSSIRKLVSLEVIEQISPYFKGIISHPNMYNSYYLFLAIVSWATKIDPVKIWIYLPQFILPVVVIAQFCLAKRLFNKSTWALLYIIFYFSYYFLYNSYTAPADGYAWLHSEIAACNNDLALRICGPVIIIVLLQYLSTDTEVKKFLPILSLLFLSLGVIHLYSQAKIYYVVGCLLIWTLILRPEVVDYKRLTRAVVYSLFLGIIFFGYINFLLRPTVNPSYKVCGGTAPLPIISFGKWLLTDPLKTVVVDPFAIAGFLFLFISIPFVKKNLVALYIFSVFFTTVFILYNPLILYMGKIIDATYERIIRLYNTIPIILAITFPFYIAFDKQFFKKVGPNILLNLLRIGLILYCIVLVIVLIKKVPERLGKIVYTKQYSLNELNRNNSFYESIRKLIPRGKTVLINISLSSWWTTYFPNYIIAHPFDCVLPPNIDQTERKKDVEYFFQNPIDEKSIDIIKKYQVDYVFILTQEMGNKDFKKYQFFDLVESNPSFSIFKVNIGKNHE